jgi:hypothetical protein
MILSKRDLIERANAREKELQAAAIAASRDGDDEAVWLCMAARAENNRFLEKLRLTPDQAQDR